MNLSKIENYYSYLKIEEFDFLSETSNPFLYFKNELEFMSFIILNEWFQRKLGIFNIKRNAYSSPDLEATILFSGEKINIEVEYKASNFKEHNHSSTYIDLILSFCRVNSKTTINSIPIWSVYKTKGKNKYIYTLDDDINRDFNKD